MEQIEITENGIDYVVDVIKGTYGQKGCRFIKRTKFRPTKMRELDFAKIISDLPKAKRKELWSAAGSDQDVNDFIQNLKIKHVRTTDDSCVIDGISALVAAGVISQAAADNLLGV